MSHSIERDIDPLLHHRPQVPPDEDLEERIIVAARFHKQRSSPAYLQWLYGIFFEFIRMEPAFVVGLLLVSGLCLGFVANWPGLEHQTGDVPVDRTQDYFYSTRSYL
jgi:hypothetical protein